MTPWLDGSRIHRPGDERSASLEPGGCLARPGSNVRKRPPQAGCRGRSPRRGWLCPCPRTRGKVRKGVRTRTVRKRRPSRPTPSRVQGAQPPPGVQGVSPCTPNVGGWAGGTTASAKPDPPLIEGARQDKTPVPIGGRTPDSEAPATPPLQNTNNCAIISHEVGGRPASLSRSLPHMFGQGDSLWTPPVAGALREQPKGQDRPRKAGTGANAVVRHRLFGAIPPRNDS